jgi:hypothetical protein
MTPQFHFLIVAPNLGPEWLFDAARRYWERYEPTLLGDLVLLRAVPLAATISVTVIAMRDTIAAIGVEVAQASPVAYLDAVVFETPEQARAELDRRADYNQPFGVPLVTPTPTPLPTATLNLANPGIPTPRLPETRQPNGYVTETPVLPPTATPPPTYTPRPPSTGVPTAEAPPRSAPPTDITMPGALPTPTETPPGQVAPIRPTPGPLTGG